MGYYPANATGLNYVTYPAGPGGDAADIATSASANTKGSFVQLAASSAFTCNAVLVALTRATTGGISYLVDVATGASGSESVVLANIPMDTPNVITSEVGHGLYSLPLAIAASTRISMRAQAGTGSKDVFSAITLVAAGGVSGISNFTAYGANTATSKPAQVDPGTSINTKGAYTELASSTSAPGQVFMTAFTLLGNTSGSSAQWAADIATGAGGSETVLCPDLRLNAAGTGGPLFGVRSHTALTYIPASTRIACRASCDITTTGKNLGAQIFLGTGSGSATGNYITYPVGPTAQAADIAGSASNNTKGSFVELAASCAFGSNAVLIHITRATAGSHNFLLDVATGASGSETAVVPNIPIDTPSTATSHVAHGLYSLPLAIAAGARISMRAQSSTGSEDVWCAITLIAAGGVSGISSFTSYGANTGTSKPAQVDPGTSINTKGAYTELASSTSGIGQVLMTAFTWLGNTSGSSANWAVDIATGAGGSESVLVPDLRLGSATTGGPLFCVRSHTVLTYIPASTRIACRASCSISSTGKLFGAQVFLGTAPASSSGLLMRRRRLAA